MTGTAVGPKFGPKFATWVPPGQSVRIEYSEAVLEQIRETAVDGYHRVPHGGVETGGILYGTHQKSVVRITAWRPIACEYAKGPSFLLSAKDEAALQETLAAPGGDADLDRLEPIGWYRAHTRSEILLSDEDLNFFNRFFPQPWQVALVVRPASFAPARAGFFLREAEGVIRAHSSYLEFTLTPVATAQSPPPEEVLRAPHIVAAPEPAPTPAAEPRPVLETEPHLPLRSRGAQWKWYAASLAALAVAALGFWLWQTSRSILTLSATDMRGQLRIVWDGASRLIRHATGGSIDIDDHGVRTQLSLTPADLRSGSIFYARQSGDVSVRLTVDVPGSSPIVQATRFLKPGESGTAPAPRLDAAKPPGAQPPPEASQARAEPPPTPPALRLPAPVKSTRAIPFRAPAKAPQQLSTAWPGIAPPKIENLPAASPAALTSVLAPVPVSPAAPAPPRPANAAPAASGRIIWTGKLAKNSRLVVERNRASSGALNGVLPEVAARVSAYPGDLTPSGITFFTADPRYSPALTEKAGAENGWNPTTYTWDPRRASGITIVEQPGSQNGYKLVLQSGIPKLSVVMLEWRATE
jgi:proteasome lid subunit RPN8/RPN11